MNIQSLKGLSPRYRAVLNQFGVKLNPSAASFGERYVNYLRGQIELLKSPRPSAAAKAPQSAQVAAVRTRAGIIPKFRHIDRDSKRYSLALHESAHAWAVAYYLRARYVDHVEILDRPRPDGTMGCVSYNGSFETRSDEARILAASWAIQHELGTTRGLGGDAEELRKLGWKVPNTTGMDLWIREPSALAALRKEVLADMRQHQRFVHRLADELYQRGRIEGDEVCELWQSQY